MPETTNNNNIDYPIKDAWLNFVKSVQLLLVAQRKDRSLDQYLVFRDKVLALVQDEAFVNELNNAWPVFTNMPPDKIGDALIEELVSFSRALEVGEVTEKKKKGWRPAFLNKWLGRAGTVTGSVKDLLSTLPPLAKNTITIFKELIDLFKSK